MTETERSEQVTATIRIGKAHITIGLATLGTLVVIASAAWNIRSDVAVLMAERDETRAVLTRVDTALPYLVERVSRIENRIDSSASRSGRSQQP